MAGDVAKLFLFFPSRERRRSAKEAAGDEEDAAAIVSGSLSMIDADEDCALVTGSEEVVALCSSVGARLLAMPRDGVAAGRAASCRGGEGGNRPLPCHISSIPSEATKFDLDSPLFFGFPDKTIHIGQLCSGHSIARI